MPSATNTRRSPTHRSLSRSPSISQRRRPPRSMASTIARSRLVRSAPTSASSPRQSSLDSSRRVRGGIGRCHGRPLQPVEGVSGLHVVVRPLERSAVLIEGIADSAAKCPKCGFELHSCKQCAYFDPSSRFECSQPIPERIPRKDARNDCTFYAMRVMVEKETSTPGAKVQDARQAFDNLFKK